MIFGVLARRWGRKGRRWRAADADFWVVLRRRSVGRRLGERRRRWRAVSAPLSRAPAL